MDPYITLLELTWTTVQTAENKDKQKLAEKQKSKMNNSVSSNWNSMAGDASKSRSGRRSPYNYFSFSNFRFPNWRSNIGLQTGLSVCK